MKRIIYIFALLGFVQNSLAFEVDNFTNRYKPLQDSRDSMNGEVNKRLVKAADAASGIVDRAVTLFTKGANQCDKDELYDEVYDEVGGWVIGSLEGYAEDNDKIKKHSESKEAIYYKDGRAMVGAGPILKIFGTHSSINMNGHYIGTDKFGHFFDEGYKYFKEFKKKSKFSEGILHALKYGEELENGEYGLASTGVFSNADLMANYSGLQFWMALTEGPNPHFKCVQGRWKMVRKFDFASYVNSGWDEAINCSKFREPAKTGIERNSMALESKAKKNGKNERYVCPVSYGECKKLASQFKNYSSYLLSADCAHGIGKDEPGLRFNGQVPHSLEGGSSKDVKVKKTNGVR